MIRANKNWSIIEFEDGEDFVQTDSGLFLPTQRAQRAMVKGKSRIIGEDPDVDIPDLIRVGTLISSKDSIFKEGSQVIFNKHDAFGFTMDDKHYYAIKTEAIIGGVEQA